MSKTHILVVDDEPGILRFLRVNFESKGYQVTTAVNGLEALQKAELEPPDLVILDITMPQMDGFETCNRLREWLQVPIIMLSARGDETDKVKCLDLGADDYMTKPFGVSELLARVRAVLRRAKTSNVVPVQSLVTSGDLKVNFAQKQVSVAGREVKLTPTEYNLLQELVLNAGKTLSHSYLLNKVWGPEYKEETEYLHVFVNRLRAKLEDNVEDSKYIATLSGVGYQFKKTT
ncbi:MAG TPA: response regulator transcription factor [Dehalococcoidales bacterium]